MTQKRIRSVLNSCVGGLTLAEICIKAEMPRSHATAAVSAFCGLKTARAWTNWLETAKKAGQ